MVDRTELPPPARPLDPLGQWTMPEDDFRLSRVFVPIIERWRLIGACALVVALLTLLVTLLLPRKYEASIEMTTVVSPRSLSLGGGLASSLLGSTGLGLQPTPQFVVKLAEMHSVISQVELSRIDSASKQRVIDRVLRKEHASLPENRMDEEMRKIVSADYDRETGIITLSVTHRDSALARLVASRLVSATQAAFRRASRAQASELRVAQEQRVDSAASQLNTAERRLVDFLRANRQIAPYSTVAVDQQSLQRAIDLAQTAYTQAITERESAIAKELEETPVVVIIDPLPDQIPPVSRKIPLKMVLAALLTTFLLSAWVVARDTFRRNLDSLGDDKQRLLAALESVPSLRRPSAAPHHTVNS